MDLRYDTVPYRDCLVDQDQLEKMESLENQ